MGQKGQKIMFLSFIVTLVSIRLTAGRCSWLAQHLYGWNGCDHPDVNENDEHCVMFPLFTDQLCRLNATRTLTVSEGSLLVTVIMHFLFNPRLR